MAAAALIGSACVAGAGAFAAASGTTLSTVRINTGGGAVSDVDGVKWKADYGFIGGKTASTTATIAGTRKQLVFRDNRYGMTGYQIPVVNGTYDVSLLETETYFNAVGKRVFSVSAEGKSVAKNVDIFALAGGMNRAYWIQFRTTVSDAGLSLGFVATVNNAQVNAISVVPAAAVTPSPTASPTASATPSATPTPTSSPTPSPTQTVTSSPTPSPTQTVTSSPTPSATSTPFTSSVMWGMNENPDYNTIEAALGHKFGLAREYRRIDQSFISSTGQSLVNSGHSLVLSVRARTSSAPVAYADIVAGKWDGELLTGMTKLNSLATPTFFIFQHEADSTAAKASCTSSSDSVCGPEFVAAWKHIYDLAHAHGLTRLRFTWTVTEYGFNPQTSVRNDYYWPGASYMDWIGVDAYNGGCNSNWWGSFATTMEYAVPWTQAHAPNLPIIIPEFGSIEGASAAAKADYFYGIPNALQQPGYTNIRAMLYWNSTEGGCDFRVTSSTPSYDAYKSVSGDVTNG